MKKTTLENDSLSSNTLIARLVSSEELANLPGNKLDVYIDGKVQYEAFVRVGTLPMPEDAIEGVFYILPDDTVHYLSEGVWDTIKAESEKPNSIYKFVDTIAEKAGQIGTCLESEIVNFSATDTVQMINNIFFYDIEGKIAVLEGLNGSDVTYRVLVSPSEGAGAWIVKTNLPNSSPVTNNQVLTLRWEDLTTIYDSKGNLVERSDFKISLKYGDPVYLLNSDLEPWALATLKANNGTEFELSVKEDLRYSKNGVWTLTTSYTGFDNWEGSEDVRVPVNTVSAAKYITNGTLTTKDPYDALNEAKLNQFFVMKDELGVAQYLTLFKGVVSTNFSFYPIADVRKTNRLVRGELWLNYDVDYYDSWITESTGAREVETIMGSGVAKSIKIDNNSATIANAYTRSHFQTNDIVIIKNSTGSADYYKAIINTMGANYFTVLPLEDLRPSKNNKKAIYNVYAGTDISTFVLDNYQSIAMSSIVDTRLYSKDSQLQSLGFNADYAVPGDIVYIYQGNTPRWKAILSDVNNTDNTISVFLIEDLYDDTLANSGLFRKGSAFWYFSWQDSQRQSANYAYPLAQSALRIKEGGVLKRRADRIEFDLEGAISYLPPTADNQLKALDLRLAVNDDETTFRFLPRYVETTMVYAPTQYRAGVIHGTHTEVDPAEVTPKMKYFNEVDDVNTYAHNQSIHIGWLPLLKADSSMNFDYNDPIHLKVTITMPAMYGDPLNLDHWVVNTEWSQGGLTVKSQCWLQTEGVGSSRRLDFNIRPELEIGTMNSQQGHISGTLTARAYFD